MNKLIITGNLGHDSDPKPINGKYVYNLAVAVTTGYGDKKQTIWYDVQLWRNDDKLGKFTKGTKLLIEGEPSVQVWMDTQGQPAGKIVVFCQHFEFLSSKGEEQPQPTLQEVNEAQRQMANAYNKMEHTAQGGDLPF